MILAGIWFGPAKPPPDIYMNSFREDLQNLYKGVDFQLPTESIKIRGLVMCGTCDLQAKALFLNMKQYNGYYGCQHCTINGARENNVQYYPYDKEIIEQAKEASRKNTAVCGVKGITVLSKVVYKYIETTAIDIMHCMYEGVMKILKSFAFYSENHEHPASLTRRLTLIYKRLALRLNPRNQFIVCRDQSWSLRIGRLMK